MYFKFSVFLNCRIDLQDFAVSALFAVYFMKFTMQEFEKVFSLNGKVFLDK